MKIYRALMALFEIFVWVFDGGINEYTWLSFRVCVRYRVW